jgi:hydroxymethylbilane synthase
VSGTLRIGTRGSELALWQARRVAALLEEASGAAPELVVVHTSGDRDRSRALHEIEGSGFFTRELQAELLAGRVDLVVHSLKDLATAEPDGLVLAAVLLRADPSELLLARPQAAGDGPLGLARGARLGTSSLRRAALALEAQPDVRLEPLRGNVPTRIRRLREGAFDAIMLAAAGVARLDCDLDGLVARRLPLERFLPAAGQGALAAETRADDRTTIALLRPFRDEAVAEATDCERAVLAGLGGGCHLPLGVHARRVGGLMRIAAALGAVDATLAHATLRRAAAEAADGAQAAASVAAALRAPAPDGAAAVLPPNSMEERCPTS